MEALFIVLNHEEHFDELLKRFADNDIRGGTILESQGLAATMAEHSALGFDFFSTVLSGGRPYNKTIFLILDEVTLEKAKECVKNVVGNNTHENIGIMFSFKLSSFEHLSD